MLPPPINQTFWLLSNVSTFPPFPVKQWSLLAVVRSRTLGLSVQCPLTWGNKPFLLQGHALKRACTLSFRRKFQRLLYFQKACLAPSVARQRPICELPNLQSYLSQKLENKIRINSSVLDFSHYKLRGCKVTAVRKPFLRRKISSQLRAGMLFALHDPKLLWELWNLWNLKTYTQ